MSDLLIEFYSEEIPAGVQEWAASKIEKLLMATFKESNLNYKKSQCFWTPMRLSVLFFDLQSFSPNISEEKRGPRVGAKDDAISGFAKNLGVKKEDLNIQKTSGGDFYFYKVHKKGLSAKNVIKTGIEDIIRNFPWKKSMYWGNFDVRWIRPLHSILCVYNNSPVNFSIGPINSSNKTKGHRFIFDKEIIINSNKTYIKKLLNSYVILDASKRVSIILKNGEKLARQNKLCFKTDLKLANEVANLVEYPFVFLAEFDEEFLKLPKEVLELALVKQQKYFPLYNKNGSLSSKFLGVSNIKLLKNAEVIKGNSRVIRARLTDAQFFYENDLKKGLENMTPQLNEIIFHSSLGSMSQKVLRISSLCKLYSNNFNANKSKVLRAAKLIKSDLCSDLVYEMPELQGKIGSRYAELNKEAKEIIISIKEHYSPSGPLDICPTIPESSLLSFADKLDSLTGFISIGLRPSGSKDPYGIRRACLGIIRIILEKKIIISIEEAVKHSINLYKSQKINLGQDNYLIKKNIMEFIYDRMKFYLLEKNIPIDQIDAVLTITNNDDLFDKFQKILSLNRFLITKSGKSLISSQKRVRRILYIEEKKIKKIYTGKVNEALFELKEEKDLYIACIKNSKLIKECLKNRNYDETLRTFQSIEKQLKIFFENVLVNVKDKKLKNNRLNILSMVRDSYSEYANFSLIDSGRDD